MSSTFNGQMVGFMLKERLGWDRPDVFPSSVELDHDCDRDNPYVVDGNVFYDRRKVRYVPERTCRLRYDEVHRDYVCSSCGMRLSLDSYQRDTEDGQVYRMFRYCPECGARVNR